jgi:serine/threonine protein kinase
MVASEQGRREEPSRSLRRLYDGIASSVRATQRPAGSTTAAQKIVGRYELHAEIAAGGMAAVHVGKLIGPVGFARTVAIKRLHPQFARDPEFVAMFLDEARLAARIQHPNVVSTLDVVATEGELFVVMEYVLGESLAQLMRVTQLRSEPVPVAIAAAIIVGVLHGLHAAHEARDERGEPLRIVHRDVSPHNILVGRDGAAHVIDFGVAKARGRAQVTRDGHVKGKLSYMPPEQLLGHAIDHRADVFAASIVLWEALTGRRLFQGIDEGDVFSRVLYGDVEPPSRHAPDLSAAMDAIVLRGLARDSAKRYPTAREMALAIEAVVHLAPPSQVGSWVAALAGDVLVERTQCVVDVETGASSIRNDASSVPEQLSHTLSNATRHGGYPRVFILLGTAIAALAILGATRASATRANGQRPFPGNAPEQTASPRDPPAPLLAATQAPASSPVDGNPAAQPVSNSRPPQRTRSPRNALPYASVRSPTPPAPNAPSCNPPFWYDADGNKRYYRHCASP